MGRNSPNFWRIFFFVFCEGMHTYIPGDGCTDSSVSSSQEQASWRLCPEPFLGKLATCGAPPTPSPSRVRCECSRWVCPPRGWRACSWWWGTAGWWSCPSPWASPTSNAPLHPTTSWGPPCSHTARGICIHKGSRPSGPLSWISWCFPTTAIPPSPSSSSIQSSHHSDPDESLHQQSHSPLLAHDAGDAHAHCAHNPTLFSSLHFTCSDLDLRSTQLNAGRHPWNSGIQVALVGETRRQSPIHRGRQEREEAWRNSRWGLTSNWGFRWNLQFH